jgi:hypothetical protein
MNFNDFFIFLNTFYPFLVFLQYIYINHLKLYKFVFITLIL